MTYTDAIKVMGAVLKAKYETRKDQSLSIQEFVIIEFDILKDVAAEIEKLIGNSN